MAKKKVTKKDVEESYENLKTSLETLEAEMARLKDEHEELVEKEYRARPDCGNINQHLKAINVYKEPIEVKCQRRKGHEGSHWAKWNLGTEDEPDFREGYWGDTN